MFLRNASSPIVNFCRTSLAAVGRYREPARIALEAASSAVCFQLRRTETENLA
jgi:hypothetical protein